MTIWKPGMRCVCVDDKWPSCEANPLKKGIVYTVRGTAMEFGVNHIEVGVSLCLTLEGVAHPIQAGWGFDCRRFRPLSETRLDQFRQHLAPVDRERADA